MAEFAVEKALHSDVGRRRSHNEDYVGCFEPEDPEEPAASDRLYVVADGVGGGAAETPMYPWGNHAPDCSRLNLDQYDSSSYECCLDDTSRVGSYSTGASPYGALDMAGNLWEWGGDWYQGGYYAASSYDNPQGPGSGTEKVLRGGSWASGPVRARSTFRRGDQPAGLLNSYGFRCCLTAQ